MGETTSWRDVHAMVYTWGTCWSGLMLTVRGILQVFA
jgi:hypothetical protein